MTICYPLKTQNDYTELRYSLRSVEKYIDKPYEILVVGDFIPGWLNNVTWIQYGDIPNRKQWSIKRKIIVALNYVDEIIFMNDDVFLLQPYEPAYYYHSLLKYYAESGSKPLMKELEAMGRTTYHFDGHYPLVYDKRFIEIVELFPSDTIIKSMYCNYLNIPGTEMQDCKLIKAMKPAEIKAFIKDKPAFSTGHLSLRSAIPILQDLFYKPSKFEI